MSAVEILKGKFKTWIRLMYSHQFGCKDVTESRTDYEKEVNICHRYFSSSSFKLQFFFFFFNPGLLLLLGRKCQTENSPHLWYSLSGTCMVQVTTPISFLQDMTFCDFHDIQKLTRAIA